MRIAKDKLALFTKSYSSGQDAELMVCLRNEKRGNIFTTAIKYLLGIKGKEEENDDHVDKMAADIIDSFGRLDLPSISNYLKRLFSDDHLRCLEYPFLCQCIAEKIHKKKIIVDIGGGNAYSTKVLMLLKIPGSRILSVDVVNHRSSSKYNVEYIRGNCFNTNLANESVDVVVSISTFEHVGLGRWGDPIDPDGDIRSMQEAHRILKPGGHVVVTLPYGAPTVVYNLHRIYDDGRIKKMIDGFSIITEEYSLHGKKCEKNMAANLKVSYQIPEFYESVPEKQKLPNAQSGILLLLQKK